MQLIEEALRAMIRNDPALLERSVQIGRYLLSMALRGTAVIAKHADALAASRQMDGFVQLLAELQSLPNFPPRLSLAAPLGQISASSFVYQPTSSGKRGKWKAAARDPIQHANIVAALCSRRAKSPPSSMPSPLLKSCSTRCVPALVQSSAFNCRPALS